MHTHAIRLGTTGTVSKLFLANPRYLRLRLPSNRSAVTVPVSLLSHRSSTDRLCRLDILLLIVPLRLQSFSTRTDRSDRVYMKSGIELSILTPVRLSISTVVCLLYHSVLYY